MLVKRTRRRQVQRKRECCALFRQVRHTRRQSVVFHSWWTDVENMVYSTEQRVFLIELYAKYSSYIKCRRKFQRKYPESDVPSKSMIERLVKKFHSTGSVLDLKKRRRRSILTEEKLDEIGCFLERNPGKPLAQLAAQSGVSLGSVYTATRLLKLRSYTVILV